MDEVFKRKPHRSRQLFIGIIIIAAVIVGAVVLISKQANHETSNIVPIVLDEAGETDREIIPLAGMNFVCLEPENWDRLAMAETNIQTLGQGQWIKPYIVSDPNDNNMVYFATSDFDTLDTTKGNMVSVYRYQLDNNNFERLFQARYNQGEFPLLKTGWPELNVLGYEKGKLILFVKDLDSSPGPCFEPLLACEFAENCGERANLIALDLTDPYGGFTEYTPPDEVIEQVKREREECVSKTYN